MAGKGSLVRMPGLPPMYDYEVQPQKVILSLLMHGEHR